MLGSATFTIVTSRTTMNWARARTVSVAHGFRVRPGIEVSGSAITSPSTLYLYAVCVRSTGKHVRRIVVNMATRTTKERLSRETVTGRALAMADADGIEALTIRRLATDLGVTPMALYWHFEDKERLLDGVAELVLSQVTLPADDESRPWDERLREVLDQLLAVLAAHPSVTDVVKTRILQSEPGLELTERVLGLLRGAGFSAERSAQQAIYALLFIVGLVTGEPGAMPCQEDDEARDARLRGKWASLQALSPKKYPHVLEAALPLTSCDDSQEWRAAGLDLLLCGLRDMQRSA